MFSRWLLKLGNYQIGVSFYTTLTPEFLLVDLQTLLLLFSGKYKKRFLKIFLYFIRCLKILFVFLKENNIFLRFCLCIFEGDTVKSDCPAQIFRKMMKYLIQTVGLPYYK